MPESTRTALDHSDVTDALPTLISALIDLQQRVASMEERVLMAQNENDIKLNAYAQETANAIGRHMLSQATSISRALLSQASADAAELVVKEFGSARPFTDVVKLRSFALERAPLGGQALEFGVYQGVTLRQIVKERESGPIYGFDTFTGLPETWRAQYPAGCFALDSMPVVEGAELIPGLIQDTLPVFLRDHPEKIDYLHIDTDIYSAADCILRLTQGQLSPDAIIVFDEFFNYPEWREHEYRAWTEFIERSQLEFDYIGCHSEYMQVAIQLRPRG